MDSRLHLHALSASCLILLGAWQLWACASHPVAAVEPNKENVLGRWHQGDFDALLAQLEPDQTMVVEVGADWCGPCHQLAWEVLDTPRTAEILRTSAGLRVDFETPEGLHFAGRYSVINLPTTLVIDARGKEMGRVEGYDHADDYVAALKEALRAPDSLGSLTRDLAADPTNLKLRLDHARAQLFAGQTEEARLSLDALVAEEVPLEIAAEAARIQGRWLLRVRHDPAQAVPFFVAMTARFRQDPSNFAHFQYWTATALVAADRHGEAEALLGAWLTASPNDVRALAYSLEFFVHHGFPPAISEPLLTQLVALDGWDADRRYTQARIFVAKGEEVLAVEAAKRAVSLEPTNALYFNYAASLVAP